MINAQSRTPEYEAPRLKIIGSVQALTLAHPQPAPPGAHSITVSH